MSLENLVSAIDAEIARLQQARQILSDISTPKKGPGRPRINTVTDVIPQKRKHRLSAAARAKIAAAQKARWAKVRKTKAAPTKSEAAK